MRVCVCWWAQVLTDTINLLSGALGQLATAFDEGVEGGRGGAGGGGGTTLPTQRRTAAPWCIGKGLGVTITVLVKHGTSVREKDEHVNRKAVGSSRNVSS